MEETQNFDKLRQWINVSLNLKYFQVGGGQLLLSYDHDWLCYNERIGVTNGIYEQTGPRLPDFTENIETDNLILTKTYWSTVKVDDGFLMSWKELSQHFGHCCLSDDN